MSKRNPGIVIWIVALACMACLLLPVQTASTPDTQAIYTSAAETEKARSTLSAGETAVAQLTQIVQRPSPTPTSTALPPTPTNTPPPSATPLPSVPPSPTSIPTATLPPVPCDQVQFLQDVTILPGTTLPAGSSFVKTWRVQNIGSCAWTTDYAVVFVSGDPMGNISLFPLPSTVAPGQTIDIAISLTAPRIPGVYLGNWMLRNPQGTVFGYGPGGSLPLQVQVTVIQAVVLSDYAYDYALNYCVASWTSGAGQLGCQGDSQDQAGSVILMSGMATEAGQTSQMGLWVRPNVKKNGWIRGRYPAYRVSVGDRFQAEVGCMSGSSGCDVNFFLEYRASDGTTGQLGVWRETYDGFMTPIDLDISALAGLTVQFTLGVANNGNQQRANAIWLAPHIQNLTPRTGLVLLWSREVSRTGSCEELRIYITGPNSGEAQAYSCSPGNTFLGRITLDSNSLFQIQSWVRQFRSFDGETYDASPEQPVITYVSFYGQGRSDTSDTEIHDISNFAGNLFAQITSR